MNPTTRDLASRLRECAARAKAFALMRCFPDTVSHRVVTYDESSVKVAKDHRGNGTSWEVFVNGVLVFQVVADQDRRAEPLDDLRSIPVPGSSYMRSGILTAYILTPGQDWENAVRMTAGEQPMSLPPEFSDEPLEGDGLVLARNFGLLPI